jgi:hypothetical protein
LRRGHAEVAYASTKTGITVAVVAEKPIWPPFKIDADACVTEDDRLPGPGW